MSFPDDPTDLKVQARIDGTWVDLGAEADPSELGPSNRVPRQRIAHTFGRKDEASKVDPMSFTVRLWNDDGLLSGVPESDWWREDDTGWDLNTRVRLLEGGAVLAEGEISKITPTWPVGDTSDDDGPGPAFVDVTVSGILRRIRKRNKTLRSSLYRLATKTTNLAHVHSYFPMEDGRDAAVLASGIPNELRPWMTFTGDLTMGADSTLEGSEPLPNIASGRTAHWHATIPAVTGGACIEVFFRMPVAPSETFSVFRAIDVYSDGDIARWSVEIRPWAGDPHIMLLAYDADGVQVDGSRVNLVSSTLWFTDRWMRLRFLLTPDGGSTDWTLGWATVTRDPDSGAGFNGSYTGTLGNIVGIGGGVAGSPSGGISVGHLVIHDGIANGWLVPADTGWFNEASRSRASRLSSEQGVPLQLVSGPDNRSIRMGPQGALSYPALMDECAETDRAILCEQRRGFGLRFVHRRWRYNRAPKLILDAAAGEIDNPFGPARDDDTIRNEVSATRLNGATATAMNQASIDKFEVYDEQVTVNCASDLILRHVAGWQLRLGMNRGLRTAQLTLNLSKAPSKRAAWRNMDVGDVIRVLNPPVQISKYGQPFDLVLQGATDEIDAFDRVVTMNCSPAAPWTVGVWGQARWSPKVSQLTSAIDADDTSISVTTPGTPWTTNDARFPLDVMFGAEQVTVTDISGAGPVQTFTVVRSVNGITRAHPAGTRIDLASAYAAVIGL